MPNNLLVSNDVKNVFLNALSLFFMLAGAEKVKDKVKNCTGVIKTEIFHICLKNDAKVLVCLWGFKNYKVGVKGPLALI